MSKRLVDGWKGRGECDCCTHQHICRNACEAHEENVRRRIQKALLLDADRKGNPGRLEGHTP